MTPLEKFQRLLRELFEFDCADLDFGVYRILNYKRDALQQFIDHDLPRMVKEALNQGALAQMQQAQERLETARQKVRETLGEDALDAQGNLREQFHTTNIGKEYLEAQQQAQGARSTEALETDLYNHLYAFFSRYWQDGDFISKRRYGHKERYAIPYNGEEVYLYWANHDQYYIKTAEYLTDYAYKTPNGVTVQFKLQNAQVEQNNVKGAKRFFLPQIDGIEWNPHTRTLTIPFEFRPLNSEEQTQFSDQQAILSRAESAILQRVTDPDAQTALAAAPNGESLLMRHLRRYTKRHTSDFFIHKDLRRFLSRELDFYLKNEALRLDDLLQGGETPAHGWLQLLQLIRKIGVQIIEFLAQFEEFQKTLWEKKKFITETFYVITMGNIPEALYPEIAQNEAQWQEWRATLHIDENKPNLLNANASLEERRLQYLKDHPTLPLDTRHFPQEFTDRLLASFENLDDATDGLLIHSENWQALNLLQEKYRERIKCIYIDPPYNTGNDGFLYRDTYRHSSWLSMMADRMNAAYPLLFEQSLFFASIDEKEHARLRTLYEKIFGIENILPTVITLVNLKGNQDEFGFAGTHEYLEVATHTKSTAIIGNLPIDEEDLDDWEEDEWGYYKIGANLRSTGVNAPREKRPNLYFPIYITREGSVSLVRTSEEDVELYPLENGKEMSWRWSKQKIAREKHNIIVKKENNSFSLYKKQRPAISDIPTKKPKSVLYKPEYSSGNGTNQMKQLFGARAYTNPKPLALIEDVVVIGSAPESIILDYFAGSGTTGHAVINLNRADGGRRKFILVEMADYFDTVLLPRLKKVTFTPEWREGKPVRMATPEEAQRSPRILKVIRLESYEDALNNLKFDEPSGEAMRNALGDEYLLRYMLHWETRHSPTMLDVDQLRAPFNYKLTLHRDGETRERLIDLPETFNYLLGLEVERRQVCYDAERRYLVYWGVQRNGARTAVIWRDLQGWTENDYQRDCEFIEMQILGEAPVDEVFVNGDCCAARAQSLDPIFKQRMFAGVLG